MPMRANDGPEDFSSVPAVDRYDFDQRPSLEVAGDRPHILSSRRSRSAAGSCRMQWLSEALAMCAQEVEIYQCSSAFGPL